MKSPMYEFLDTMPGYKPYKQTGFADNHQASLGLFFDENLSISRWMNEGPLRKSKNNLFQMRDSGKLTEEEFNMFSTRKDVEVDVDWDGLINHVNKKYDMQLKTHVELKEGIREELKGRREYAQKIMADANGAGIIGQMFGTFHAALLDPITFPTFVIGIGPASKGASFIARMAKGAVRAGSVEGAAEAAIQPFVYSWKNEIGAEYSLRDAVTNIMMVTGGAGVLGGVAGGLTKGVEKVWSVGEFRDGVKSFIGKNKGLANTNPEAAEAIRLMKQVVKLTDGAPSDQSVMEALQNITKTVQSLESPKPRWTVDMRSAQDKKPTQGARDAMDKSNQAMKDMAAKETEGELQSITDQLNKLDLLDRKADLPGGMKGRKTKAFSKESMERQAEKAKLEKQKAKLIAVQERAKPKVSVDDELQSVIAKLNKLDLLDRKIDLKGGMKGRKTGAFTKEAMGRQVEKAKLEKQRANLIALQEQTKAKPKPKAKPAAAEAKVEPAIEPELAELPVATMKVDDTGQPVYGKSGRQSVESVKPLKEYVAETDLEITKLQDLADCFT